MFTEAIFQQSIGCKNYGVFMKVKIDICKISSTMSKIQQIFSCEHPSKALVNECGKPFVKTVLLLKRTGKYSDKIVLLAGDRVSVIVMADRSGKVLFSNEGVVFDPLEGTYTLAGQECGELLSVSKSEAEEYANLGNGNHTRSLAGSVEL